MKKFTTLALLLTFAIANSSQAEKPNIVLLFADDLGYGDVHCNNPEGKILTPHIDRLAREGVRFTDAHAAGTLCVQSRYGLMTGRSPLRENYRQIDASRLTLPALLQKNGYTTAMVGKWHLDFPETKRPQGTRPRESKYWDAELLGGPCDRGFDSFFGMHASLDIPPYFYIRDRKAVALPTEKIDAKNSPAASGWNNIQGEFWRAGGIAPDLNLAEVMPTFTREAVQVIEKLAPASKKGKPFFLYYAFTSPHTPWLPTKEFVGKSDVPLYGDFVAQTDATVGKILDALEKQGVAENTLVLFSSDNGPVWYPKDCEKYGHSATAQFSGMKADAWEGGHRMPFVARWLGKIKPGSVCDETLCLTDLLQTFAALVGDEIPKGTTADSWNMLPALLGEKHAKPIRPYMIVKTSLRQGDWKYISHGGPGGFSKAQFRKNPDKATGQLYNLRTDPGEKNNLWKQEPERLATMKKLHKKVLGPSSK